MDILSKVYKALKALVTRKVTIECDRIPYHFENVPYKKIINWILVEISIFFKPDRPWGMPTHLQIEPSTYCNIKCALCPVTEGMDRPAGNMDWDLFKKLIDEAGDYVFLILLWDWGEPFLNPSIYKMIAYAKTKGIKIVSSTNGILFKEEKHADEVIRSGLDSIIFAIDGISQETYEHYRQGGDLESAMDGIRMIVRRKRELKSKTPFINFRFIVMRHNEHEIPELYDLVKSIGVDALTLKTLNPYSNDTYVDNRTDIEQMVTEFVPLDEKNRRFNYSEDGVTRIRRKNNPCKSLWNNPFIHVDGTVCACTYDYNEKYPFGNMGKSSFKNIWFGADYRRMRSQFRRAWEKHPFCNECTYAYEGGSCYNESVRDPYFFGEMTNA